MVAGQRTGILWGATCGTWPRGCSSPAVVSLSFWSARIPCWYRSGWEGHWCPNNFNMERRKRTDVKAKDMILMCCSNYANHRITLCNILMLQNIGLVGSKFLTFWKKHWRWQILERIKNKLAKQGPLATFGESVPAVTLFHQASHVTSTSKQH